MKIEDGKVVGMAFEPQSNQRHATYESDAGLAAVYVYIVPEEDFPEPGQLYSEERTTDIVLDRERGSNRLLGIEILTSEEPRVNPKTS